MPVGAISTVEIRLPAGADADLERHLCFFAAGLADLPGCLACTVFLSPKEPNLWVLIGHWCAAEQMTIHFSNELMEAMLRSLVGYPVDIEFSHFLKKPTETSAETRNPGNILVGMNVTADTEQAPC
jgi:quinol monooxygenase YgiN